MQIVQVNNIRLNFLNLPQQRRRTKLRACSANSRKGGGSAVQQVFGPAAKKAVPGRGGLPPALFGKGVGLPAGRHIAEIAPEFAQGGRATRFQLGMIGVIC